MNCFTKHNHNGVVFRTADTLSSPHAFSTRLGGVSAGHLASLNLSVRRGDSEENVRENWRRLGKAAGMDLTEVVYARQIHSRIVPVVTRADAQNPWLAPHLECDGFVTAEPGLPVAIFVADCIPVLLEDLAHGVVAAVHCGWRGSVQDILGAALSQMRSLGARPEDVSAAIGPGIGACCFEVGPEVAEGVDALLGGGREREKVDAARRETRPHCNQRRLHHVRPGGAVVTSGDEWKTRRDDSSDYALTSEELGVRS